MRYFDLLAKVYNKGSFVKSRGLMTKELIGETLTVDNYNAVSVEPCRSWEDVSRYLYAEWAWYLTGDRTLDVIRPYSKFWDKIANSDGTINSNYGDLVFYRKNRAWTSYEWAYYHLCLDKETRKAIILYNDRKFFFKENKDLICNQYQQFFIRDNTLHSIMALRSSDMIFGLTFNIPWWSLVQQQLFLRLRKHYYPELKLGPIQALLGSVHIYENKLSLVEDMLFSTKKEYRFLELKTDFPLFQDFEYYQMFLTKWIEEHNVS